MLPVSLLPEDIVRTDGVGPTVDVSRVAGELLVATLGINRATEQTGLVLSIWGSPDGVEWGLKPLAAFPQKIYCGLYSKLVNLAANPGVRYLRAQWKVNRLSKSVGTPLFGIFVDAERSGSRVGIQEGVSAFIHAAVA